MTTLIKRISLLFGILLFLTANGMAEDKVAAFVSIVPQKYFVQQIGKDRVDVQVMVQPGASPASYEPKPRQMADLTKARLYFAIGVAFENAWLEKIAAANPKMKVVHTDQGIEKRRMANHYHHDDSHDHGESAHQKGGAQEKAPGEYGGSDPHIWVSPPLVKVQAQAILAALQEADPDHRNMYEANYKEFIAKVDALDAELKKIFEGKKGLQFMVFHPAWGYFADAYGLQQVPIEIEGKSPKPAQLKELIHHARESGVKVIFVQPQFSAKSARLVAGEIGGQVAFANPLAEDWMGNLQEVAGKFKAALK